MSFLEILLLLFGLFLCVVEAWFCLMDSPCYHDSSNKSRRMMGAETCSPQCIEPLPCLAINSSNSSPLLWQQKVVQKHFPPLKIHYCPYPFLMVAFIIYLIFLCWLQWGSFPCWLQAVIREILCQMLPEAAGLNVYQCLNRYEIGSWPWTGVMSFLVSQWWAGEIIKLKILSADGGVGVSISPWWG